MSKVLLITGATGQQGGAVIQELLAATPDAVSQYTILGVTRDANSASAKKLASQSAAIRLLQGNLDDVPGLFRTASEITKQPIWGVFSVQVPGGKGQTPETEERYGKALVDEAIKHGVKQFVYTSVERGGDERSWTNETYVPHFQSKHRIEHHLRDQTAAMPGADRMNWTILRPVAFMNNIKPGFSTQVFMAAWRSALGEKPLQLVAVSDIGWFGAQAFMNPAAWRNRSIGLAGDDLNFQGLDRAFRNAANMSVPVTFGFLGSALLWGVKEVGLMMNWFREEGYAVDIQKLRIMNPKMMDFETYLKTQSGYVKKE